MNNPIRYSTSVAPWAPAMSLYRGDCLPVLRSLPPASVAAVVTDPPYGLSDVSSVDIIQALTAWVSGDRERVPNGKGFMDNEWDRFVPPPAVWDECYRVLKPGGYMAVFAGSRTADLMGLSIRLAGFEMRDTITWMYGSGFPKSLDIGKAIDKVSPRLGMFRAFADHFLDCWQKSGLKASDFVIHFPHYKNAASITAQIYNWKLAKNVPSVQDFHILQRLIGLSDEWWILINRVEVERVVTQKAKRPLITSTTTLFDQRGSNERERKDTAVTEAAKQWDGWGTALKPAGEPIIVARKPFSGTVATNVLEHGTGGMNIDGCRVDTKPRTIHAHGNVQGTYVQPMSWGEPTGHEVEGATKRWPANVVLSHTEWCDEERCENGCPVAELDAQSGITLSIGGSRGAGGQHGAYSPIAAQPDVRPGFGDTGGASRFFNTFRYQAKAPKSERPVVNGVAHPTVKPRALMEWLVTLFTPTYGTVLDPFTGSGTTGESALRLDFNSIVIEREQKYWPLIDKRLGDYLDSLKEKVS